MKFDEFTKEILKRIQSRLPDQCSLILHPVPKNNGVVRTGIVLKREDEQISPTIYLEDYYNYYLHGYSLDTLAESVTRVFFQDVSDIREKIGLLKQKEFDRIRSHIIFRLVNRKKNDALTKECPTVPYLDLSIIFYYLVDYNKTGINSVRITNALADYWSVSTSELFQAALENMPVHFPFVVEKLTDMIHNLIPKSRQIDEVLELSEPLPMYVLTNQSGINGSTVLLYKEVLNQLSCHLNSDLYLLPSSVHEIIAIPYETKQQQLYLEKMVHDINETQLGPEEILSDHVYVFLRDSEDVVYQNPHV